MRSLDEIPELPWIKDGDMDYKTFETVLKDMHNSGNALMFYENDKGMLKHAFTDNLQTLYACMVVHLCQAENMKLWEFLRLVLEGVHQVKKCNRKGHESAVKIETVLPRY